VEHCSHIENWIYRNDLDLAGELSVEWDRYRIALFRAGATIRDTKDELMWTGGDTSRTISIKNAYSALIST